MPDYRYAVALTVNGIPEASCWVVGLLCADHQTSDSPKDSACALAKAAFKETWPTRATINSCEASKLSPPPLSLTSAHARYTAPYGCCAWIG